MVKTRTQTGVITEQKYDPKTLAAHETIPSVPILYHSPNPKLKSGRVTKNTGRKNSKASRSGQASPRINTKLLLAELEKDGKTIRLQGDLNEGCPNFFPQTVIGAHEAVGKSKIQRADERIAQWEEIRDTHRGPYPKIVPYLEAKIQEAKDARAKLEDNEENNRVGAKNVEGIEISKRLRALEWALSTAQFEPESQNIRCAIDGYRTGAISYSDQFTIIYAGKIVDHASTYGEFVADRQERLDRYAREHGPHWLWYERPLKVHAEDVPTMAACATLTRREGYTGMGGWRVKQSFWKRSGWVARIPDAGTGPAAEYANFEIRQNGEVYCQADGPKLTYRTLLDSGANWPALCDDDFRDLGIDKTIYAAQAVETIDTVSAKGTSWRVYELFVQVLDESSKSLVDAASPVHPQQPAYLGGLCPVVDLQYGRTYDSRGIDKTMRLSGILPFLACYVQATPNRPHIFLGEDRKDVLGSHRMPGQRRWELGGLITTPPPKKTWEMYGDPMVKFKHKDGRIIDEDDPNEPHASTLTFGKGTTHQHVIHVNPAAGLAPP